MSDRVYGDAREFDRRATFQRMTLSRSITGAPEETWADVCTAWVGLRRQNLSERLKEPVVADKLQSVRDYILRMRAETVVNNNLTVDCRVVISGVYYDIKAITDDAKMSRVIEMQIRAGINDG